MPPCAGRTPAIPAQEAGSVLASGLRSTFVQIQGLRSNDLRRLAHEDKDAHSERARRQMGKGGSPISQGAPRERGSLCRCARMHFTL